MLTVAGDMGRRHVAWVGGLALAAVLLPWAGSAQDAPGESDVPGASEQALPSSTSTSTSESESESDEDLQGRLQDLGLRVQGLEGKLRDSAAARKQADQARMEAERRLAEGIQERDRQAAEIGLLRDSTIALKAQVERLEQELGEAVRARRESDEALRRMGSERDAALLAGERLEQALARERERVSKLEARTSEQAEDLRNLSRDLADGEAESRRLEVALRALENERDALGRRLDALRSNLPARDGGSLSPETALARASDAAGALREARADPRGSRDARARQDLREAEQQLHRRQFDLARVSGARGVYRVRPSDSLVLIARRFYGDSGRWESIHDANRHVLDDPDHLEAGTTLVIP